MSTYFVAVGLSSLCLERSAARSMVFNREYLSRDNLRATYKDKTKRGHHLVWHQTRDAGFHELRARQGADGDEGKSLGVNDMLLSKHVIEGTFSRIQAVGIGSSTLIIFPTQHFDNLTVSFVYLFFASASSSYIPSRTSSLLLAQSTSTDDRSSTTSV